ncbi:hypothetical protein VIMY103929_19725 [Vibrio mytili]
MTDALKNLVYKYEQWNHILQNGVATLLLLFCRLWVAWVFFHSGLLIRAAQNFILG